MTRLAFSSLIAVVLLPGVATAALVGAEPGFRCLPEYAIVTSVSVAEEPQQNNVSVCYRVPTTLPRVDKGYYLWKTSDELLGTPDYSPNADAAMPIDPQHGFVLGSKDVLLGVAYGYLNSTPQHIESTQIAYFSGMARFKPDSSARAIRKDRELVSFIGIYPEYQNVEYCETITFEKVHSPDFLRSLFSMPFLIGELSGITPFYIELGFPGFRGQSYLKLPVEPSPYVVPLFGGQAEIEEEQLTINVSTYMNTSLFLDAQQLPEEAALLREQFADIIGEFEEKWGIAVPAVITPDTIATLLRTIAQGFSVGTVEAPGAPVRTGTET